MTYLVHILFILNQLCKIVNKLLSGESLILVSRQQNHSSGEDPAQNPHRTNEPEYLPQTTTNLAA